MSKTYKILKLLLLLLLQLLEFPEFLFPEIMFVVEPLVLVVAVDDLRRRGCDDDPVNLELSRSLSCFLLQIHLLDVVSRQRSLPLDGGADDALLFLFLLLLRLLVLDEVVAVPDVLLLLLLLLLLLRSRRSEDRNNRRFDVLPVFGARRFGRKSSSASQHDFLVLSGGVAVELEVAVLEAGVLGHGSFRLADLVARFDLDLFGVWPIAEIQIVKNVLLRVSSALKN